MSMSMSVSKSTCREHSDSLLESPMLAALGKEDGKGDGGGGSVTIREGRHGGGKEGRGMRGSQS